MQAMELTNSCVSKCESSSGSACAKLWNLEDHKIAKLRGILKGLQEENQSTQLLKVESEDPKDLELITNSDCTKPWSNSVEHL